MANELTLGANLGYAKNETTVERAVSAFQVTVAGNGLNSLTAYVAPTAETAIPLGSVTLPGGWLYLRNNDPTNFVTLRTQVGGEIISKMLPGDFVEFRMPDTSPIVVPSTQCDTAPCSLSLAVFDK